MKKIIKSAIKSSDAAKHLYLTYGDQRKAPLQVGTGNVNIGEQAINEQDWTTYKDIYFEHSDTCPARRSRKIQENKNLPILLGDKLIKVAACSYLMDKCNNVLLTQRLSTLRIFPQAWVLPGGHVDFGETFEEACLREIYEEVGIQIFTDSTQPSQPSYYIKDNNKRISQHNQPQNQDKSNQALRSNNDVEVTFEPYYLYESCTMNILDIDDHRNEKFPPKSQHMVLIFKAQINECYQNISLELNKQEVEAAAWVSLDQFKDTFHERHSEVDGYQLDNNIKTYDKPNCRISTQALYPIYRYNPLRQGLGKGHYLALKYLLQMQGIKVK